MLQHEGRQYRLNPTQHSLKQILSKGLDPHAITAAFDNPESINESRTYPGQHRISGKGVCLVGEFRGNDFHLITAHEDKVMTPPRPDQLKTPEGQEYARRYAANQARAGSNRGQQGQ